MNSKSRFLTGLVLITIAALVGGVAPQATVPSQALIRHIIIQLTHACLVAPFALSASEQLKLVSWRWSNLGHPVK